MNSILSNCNLCPRNCGINRYEKVGACGANYKIKIAHFNLHEWEEPVISGNNGSGTIFFSHCNLKCIFCQNKKISSLGYGKEITGKRFREICLELQSRGAHNINLVTPTHYVPQIVNEIKKIKNRELNIPIVYNTSSYENVGTIKMLNEVVDIFLADFKYFDNDLGVKYSNCSNYFEVAAKSIKEMYSQVGPCKIVNDIMTKGIIVRVLVLPGHVEDSLKIIKYLYSTYKNNIWISIMSQFTPCNLIFEYDNLNREITEDEYNTVIEYACELGIKNSFIQVGNAASESFIPDFNCENV